VKNTSVSNEKSDLEPKEKQPVVDESKVQKQSANDGSSGSNKGEVVGVVGTDLELKEVPPTAVQQPMAPNVQEATSSSKPIASSDDRKVEKGEVFAVRD
jgi:hypothetical protein